MRAPALMVLSILLWTPPAFAEAPSHLQRTQAQLRRIAGHAAADSHDTLLAHVRRAVAAAERAGRAGHVAEAERALVIADAAIELWRARAERDQARVAARAAERRAAAAEARAAEARHALAATRAQRRAHDANVTPAGGDPGDVDTATEAGPDAASPDAASPDAASGASHAAL